MKAKLTWTLVIDDEPSEIEMLRERIGSWFDVVNDAWEFFDAALESVEATDER